MFVIEEHTVSAEAALNILLEELRDEDISSSAEHEALTSEGWDPAIGAASETKTELLAAERHVLPLACLGSGCLDALAFRIRVQSSSGFCLIAAFGNDVT